MAAGKRAAILSAASRLFAERGADAVGLEELLRESGAGVGTFYHHFPGGKADVIAALRAGAAGSFADGFRRVLARNRHGETGLRAGVHHVVRWVTENPEQARLYLQTEPDSAFLRELHAWAASVRLPPTAPDVLWSLWLGPVLTWARLWLADSAATPPDRAAEALSASVPGARPRS